MHKPELPASGDGPPCSHIVQLYGSNDAQLVDDVARYLAAGAAQGQGLLVLATPARTSAIRRALRAGGFAHGSAERSGLLRFLDARETLDTFMTAGYPDWERFERYVGDAAREVHATAGGLRAYGEMVGLLWQGNQFPSAIRLEQLWNRLQRTLAFDLYCAYPIDIFDRQFELGLVGGLLGVHDHLLSAHRCDILAGALDAAARDVLAGQPELLRIATAQPGCRATSRLPGAETAILWLRSQVPDHADEIVRRAREAYVRATTD